MISDTHFGAWTGEDILREPENLALLEPWLDVDEVIFLGDMFDLLFGAMPESLAAARGLLSLLRDRLQGRRFVFLAGNHDHHFVARETETRIGLEVATGSADEALGPEMRRIDIIREILERQLEGVEVDIRYPTYTFAGVLCAHGHQLDLHAHRTGGRGNRLLTRALWAIAVGGEERVPTFQDYEASLSLLTGLLFTIAQLPNGTHAQRRVFTGFQALGRAMRLGTAPVRALEQVESWTSGLLPASSSNGASDSVARQGAYEAAREQERQRQRRTGAPAGAEASSYALGRAVRPGDPHEMAITAFETAVINLGWARDTDKIVFAHTHQPFDDLTGPSGTIRYWNTGSWIYEPDLRSRAAYRDYLANAWPGTAVLIDSDEAAPRLIRMREHLNPLHISAGTASPGPGRHAP